MSRGSGSSGKWLKCCLVVFAIASALCVSGPALYWKFNKSVRLRCPPCHCNCPPPMSLPGLINLSVTDCGKNDTDLYIEMQKQSGDLLTEELKLLETVTAEHMHHMNITINEAQRLASQYQREASKCNAATEICEEARERAEALLRKEKKLTSMWEKRARQLGWQAE